MDVGWTVTQKDYNCEGKRYRPQGGQLAEHWVPRRATGREPEPEKGGQSPARNLPQVAGRGKAVTKEMQESQPRWEESGREF